MSNYKLNAFSLSDRARFEIQKYIGTMDLQKDNKLPREERLAEIIGVSRITIRQALNDLAAEGLIFRRQGRGTFVNVYSEKLMASSAPFPSVKTTTSVSRSPSSSSVAALLNVSTIVSASARLPDPSQQSI